MELEKSILGCLIIDNSLINKAKQELQTSYFYSHIHQLLYDEIIDCHAKKGIADITVLNAVDVETIVNMTSNVTTVERYSNWKKELIELGVKRELLKAVESIKNNIEHSESNLEDLKIDILNSLNNVCVTDCIEDKSDITSILLDCMTSLEKKQTEGINRKWGIKWLDEKTGGIKPALTYLSARPSIGKTAFALQIGKYIARQGSKVAIFSLEMDKLSMCNRLICNAGGINKDYFDKCLAIPDEVWGQIGKISSEISALPLHIFDKFFAIEEILLQAEELRTKSGLDFLIVDYVQLCESRQKFNSTNDRISYISRQLKKYQQKTGIHILALSQFNRETEQKKFPTLANLRDSGSLEQDANNVFFLHEEYQEPDTEKKQAESKELLLIIAKQREGERNIATKLKFYGNTQRFYDN
jgi:replicative DNA helicase